MFFSQQVPLWRPRNCEEYAQAWERLHASTPLTPLPHPLLHPFLPRRPPSYPFIHLSPPLPQTTPKPPPNIPLRLQLLPTCPPPTPTPPLPYPTRLPHTPYPTPHCRQSGGTTRQWTPLHIACWGSIKPQNDREIEEVTHLISHSPPQPHEPRVSLEPKASIHPPYFRPLRTGTPNPSLCPTSPRPRPITHYHPTNTALEGAPFPPPSSTHPSPKLWSPSVCLPAATLSPKLWRPS